MVASKSFTISVPASSANLGPGFDSLGIGLNLRNDFRFTKTRSFSAVSGGDYGVDTDWRENLVIKVYLELCEHYKKEKKPFSLESVNRIPMQSGLGSSATAILAGVAAFRIMHELIDPSEYSNCLKSKSALASKNKSTIPSGFNELKPTRLAILRDALIFESHPDNLSAALFGGLNVAYLTGGEPKVITTNLEGDFVCLIFYPHTHTSTAESRKKLNNMISLDNAVKNIARASLLCLALQKGELDYLFDAMLDEIHEPFRMNPVAEYPKLKEKLKSPEFYGWAISGSGPSVIVFCSPKNKVIKSKIRDHLQERNLDFNFFDLVPDYDGLTVDI